MEYFDLYAPNVHVVLTCISGINMFLLLLSIDI